MRGIGLYSLIAFACVFVAGSLAVGVVWAMSPEDESVERANTPTVSTPPEPPPETTREDKDREDKEKAKEPSEQEEEKQDSAERQSAQRSGEREAGPKKADQTAAPSSTLLNLTVPSIGLYNNTVTNSIAEGVLANGAGKLPSTGFPWQQGANTYIAAHVYGYPGTGSWQQFADLPSMGQGDAIFLTASNGTTYEYRVSEILRVAPTDVWVAQPTGQTMVSLQTCVGPGWSERLVVRGVLVDTRPA